jgi:hypothetical protein
MGFEMRGTLLKSAKQITSSKVVLPLPVGPVMANNPAPFKGAVVKSTVCSPRREFMFLNLTLFIFMGVWGFRPYLSRSKFVTLPNQAALSAFLFPGKESSLPWKREGLGMGLYIYF